MISVQISGVIEDTLELRIVDFGENTSDLLAFRVKCDDSFTARSGDVVVRTVWVPCTAWKQRAHEIMAMGIAPGDYVEIEGKLTSMKADAEKGTKAYSTSVSVRDIKIISGRAVAIETPF